MFVQDEPLVYLRLDEVDDVDEVLVLLQEPPTLRGSSDYDEGDGVAPLGSLVVVRRWYEMDARATGNVAVCGINLH